MTVKSEAPHQQASDGPEDPEVGTPAPQSEAPVEDDGQVSSGSTATDEAAFSEGSFNADELPDELRPVYRQMQAAYTQKTQSLADQRREAAEAMEFMQALQNEQDRSEALRQLVNFVGPDAYLTAAGYEFEDEDDDESDESDNPQVASDPRLDEIVQWRESLQAQQDEDALISQIESFTEGEFARLGVEDDSVKELVLGRATVYDLDESGMPQIQQATEDVTRLLDERTESWIKSKKSAGRGPTPGQAAEEDEFEFSDVDERQARMAARLEAHNSTA